MTRKGEERKKEKERKVKGKRKGKERKGKRRNRQRCIKVGKQDTMETVKQAKDQAGYTASSETR